MDERLARLEQSVKELADALRNLDGRLAAVEQRVEDLAGGAAATPTASPTGAGADELGLSLGHPDLVGTLSLVGRTLLVFGGAYLLRALTDAGTVPRAAGIGLGFVYALAWIVAADRASAARRRLSGVFHGTTAALIAFPLIWEATTRFGLILPASGAGALGLVTALALAVAWRHKLHGLAWTVTVGGIVTSFALLGALAQPVPLAVYLIGLGIAALWLGYVHHWIGLRWVAAPAADAMVLGVSIRALNIEPLETPGTAIAIQLLLLAAYLATIGVRTLVRGRNVLPFEVVQTVAALVVGLGGAVMVVRGTGLGAALLGASSLALGAAAYAVALAFVDRHQDRAWNVYFYAALGLVFVIVGSTLVLPVLSLVALWALLAVATTWLALRLGRASLAVHGVVYTVAAGLASGLLATTLSALAGPAREPWSPVGLPAWLALAATGACALMTVPAGGTWARRVPRLLQAVLLVGALGGVMIWIVTPALAGLPGGGADPGVLATIRTGVLSVAALVLAGATRFGWLSEFGWLFYPVLVVGGLKLVTEDFRASRPSTLFIALACYGLALIVAPRLSRRTASVGR